MNKLKLSLEELAVETFETDDEGGVRALSVSGPPSSDPGAPLCASCVDGGCDPTTPWESCPTPPTQDFNDPACHV